MSRETISRLNVSSTQPCSIRAMPLFKAQDDPQTHERPLNHNMHPPPPQAPSFPVLGAAIYAG